MKCGYRTTNNAARLVVVSISRKVRKKNIILRTLHEQRFSLMCQYGGRSLSGPPAHQKTTKLLLRLDCNLEHRRDIALADGQKVATVGNDGIAVRREAPTVKVVIKLGRMLIWQNRDTFRRGLKA